MRRSYLILLVFLILMQPLAVSAMTAQEAKQDWYDAKNNSLEARQAHRDAKVDRAADRSPENDQKVVDTGKDSLHAALDEAEAWLIWKGLEAQEDPRIPDDIKQSVQEDVDKNLEKIDELRADVDGVENQFQLGVVFIKMVGSYTGLLTDVARNTGSMWVYVAGNQTDRMEEYEVKLRDAATDMSDNSAILDELDLARVDINSARENIDNAEAEYQQVTLPGTPLINFSNGNNYLRIARADLLGAHKHLEKAYSMILAGGK